MDDIRRDPLMTAIHFEEFNSLMKHITCIKPEPLGKVIGHFASVEFQKVLMFTCSCG